MKALPVANFILTIWF